MKTLQKLKKLRAEKVARMKEFGDKAEAAAKARDESEDLTDEQRKEAAEKAPELTAEERKEWAKVGKECDDLKAEIENLEADEALIAKGKKEAEDLEKGQGRKTQPPVPGQGVITDPVDPDADSQPRRFTIPARARQHGVLRNFSGDVGGFSADQRAYRFGMWALATLSVSMPGRFRFPKAEQFVGDYMAAEHQENDISSGGQYLVPIEFGRDFIDLRLRFGVARRLLKVVKMTSDTRTDRVRVDGLTAHFTGEGQAGTKSKKQWSQVQLVAKKITVLSSISSELDEDAVIDVGDDLAGEISYAFAQKEDQCAFNGDGTSTFGGITGVRTALTTGTKAGLKTQGTGNTWAALVLADFHNVVGALPDFADTDAAAWVTHKTFYHSVMQKLELAQGGVTAMETREGNRRPRPLFLGYPVEFSNAYPSTTATSSLVATLGDYAMGARLGDRRQERISFSEHATVDGENVFERDEIAVKGTERFDVNVHSVGDATNAGPIVGLETGS